MDSLENKKEEKDTKYPTEILLHSETINSFRLHSDIVRAILVKDEYSIQDAKRAIETYIKSFDE